MGQESGADKRGRVEGYVGTPILSNTQVKGEVS